MGTKLLPAARSCTHACTQTSMPNARTQTRPQKHVQREAQQLFLHLSNNRMTNLSLSHRKTPIGSLVLCCQGTAYALHQQQPIGERASGLVEGTARCACVCVCIGREASEIRVKQVHGMHRCNLPHFNARRAPWQRTRLRHADVQLHTSWLKSANSHTRPRVVFS